MELKIASGSLAMWGLEVVERGVLRSESEASQAWHFQRLMASILPRTRRRTWRERWPTGAMDSTVQPKYVQSVLGQATPSEQRRFLAPLGLRVAFQGTTSTRSAGAGGIPSEHWGQSSGDLGVPLPPDLGALTDLGRHGARPQQRKQLQDDEREQDQGDGGRDGGAGRWVCHPRIVRRAWHRNPTGKQDDDECP